MKLKYMGFNKRFIGKNNIETFLNGGVTLKSLFKADALIFMDNESSKVFEWYNNGTSEEEIKVKLIELNGQKAI
jgi:hypothetical protein